MPRKEEQVRQRYQTTTYGSRRGSDPVAIRHRQRPSETVKTGGIR